MKQMDAVRQLSLAATVALAGAVALCGCKADHPDDKPAVINALGNQSLFSVTVTEDRHNGVITLTGDVATNDSKLQAASLAGQAAPGYSIANNIRVVNIGFGTTAAATSGFSDSAIEQNFQALIKSDKDLNDQRIQAKVTNGTLVLKGTVRTAVEKNEADLLAWRVPNVATVVNQLTVRSKKHTTEKS
jgi:osmotically-inducible protein OsmY